MLGLLLPLLFPSLVRKSAKNDLTICVSNLRGLTMAMQLYTDDNNEVFPAHRNNSQRVDAMTTEWWGTTILDYAQGNTNRYRCPTIKGTRIDRGIRWSWRFDPHRLGYGYNGFFLGVHPYQPHGFSVGGVQFTGGSWVRRSSIVRPGENILFADKQPYGDPPVWGSVLWWPNACMDTRKTTSRAYEGVETLRHAGVGNVAFNDGHVEPRRDANINPPSDPSSGNPTSTVNSRYWDPQDRGR